jgi:proton-dependent oligopeptide transporter, POT family
VILIVSAFVILFWTGFEQAGGLMNLYTDRKVDRAVLGWTVPTTWFQSFNSWFIVILGVPFAALWTWLGKKGKDPSIPTKMAFGLILLGVGFVFMLGASKESEMTGKASILWVAAAYLFHTMGELCLSPVGLSMVSKLAPKRYASMLMGTWFLANAIANKLAGVIGSKAGKLGEFAIFGGIAATAALGGLVLLALSGTLRRMMHGADTLTPASEDSNKTGGGLSIEGAEKSLS